MTKRLLALLLAVMTMVMLLLPATAAVSAEDYPNTYTNTGNQRQDIVQVALTQVGYTEGSNNYTKYGVFHGNPNAQWCGYFVSWCARQAGIPTSILPKAGLANPNAWGLSTFTSDERIPQPGDIFFKGRTGNRHMGIVYYVEGNTVYTIEGNTSKNTYEGYYVLVQARTLSEHRYASPNYTGGQYAGHTHSYSDHFEDAHPHKIYKQCDSCGYTTYTGEQKTLDSCTQCIQANCSHSYSNWEFSTDGQHKRTCSKCSKVETGDHGWQDSQIIKEANCKEAGSKVQKCSTCNAERTKTVDKTGDHIYSAWSYVNDEIHKRSCNFCGYTETKEHDLGEEAVWSTDDSQHWHECSVCEQQISKSEHSFGEDCVSPCEVCDFVRPDGHTYAETWSYSEEAHWYECTKCGERSTAENHSYSVECDEDCDICGYIREVTHTFDAVALTADGAINVGAENTGVSKVETNTAYTDTTVSTPAGEEHTGKMMFDAAGHWYECEVCGKHEGEESHTPGPEATEEAAQVCTTCGYEIAAKLDHVHKYEPFQTNTMTHWGKCSCGHELLPEAHVWDVATGKCATCGKMSIVETKNTNWDVVWVAAGVALVGAVILSAGLMAASRRKRREMDADPYWA